MTANVAGRRGSADQLPLPVTTSLARGTAGTAAPSSFSAAPHPLVVIAYGKPITQGSKVRNRYGGLRDDNAETLKPWREAVKTAALDVMRAAERITVPVSVALLCYFDRPTVHYRTGRNAHLLRDAAPLFPANVRSGDIDKLQRACFDALTDAGVFVDDSQVVHVTAWKLWTGEHVDALPIPGVRIEIRPLTATTAS